MRSKVLLILGMLISLGVCNFTPTRLNEIEAAQELILQHRYKEAIASYETLLNKTLPREVRVKVYYQLGDLYSIYLSKNEKAIEYYTKAKDSTGDILWTLKTYERIAEIQFSFLKNYEESLLNYSRLTAFLPKLQRNDFYQYRQALSAFRLGKMDLAGEIFRDILMDKQHKYNVISMYYIGLIHFQKEEWKSAVVAWQKYIKNEIPDESVVQTKFLIANAYETMEELKKAYNIYRTIRGKYSNNDIVESKLRAIYDRRIARKRD